MSIWIVLVLLYRVENLKVVDQERMWCRIWCNEVIVVRDSLKEKTETSA